MGGAVASQRGVLEEPTIRLVPLSEAHAAATLAWVADPLIRKNLGIHRQPSLQWTRDWIRSSGKESGRFPLAIVWQDEHVGNVVLDQFQRRLGTVRLSIYIGDERARGRGLGEAAVRGAVQYAFGELELRKVWLIVHVDNLAAYRSYLKAGFHFEGIRREEFLLEGQFVDAIYMGIIRPGPWVSLDPEGEV